MFLIVLAALNGLELEIENMRQKLGRERQKPVGGVMLLGRVEGNVILVKVGTSI